MFFILLGKAFQTLAEFPEKLSLSATAIFKWIYSCEFVYHMSKNWTLNGILNGIQKSLKCTKTGMVFRSYLETAPFDYLMVLGHFKIGQVQYSDPHCSFLHRLVNNCFKQKCTEESN